MIHFFNIIQTVTRKMSMAISENSIIAPSHFLFFQLLNLLINDWLQYCEPQPQQAYVLVSQENHDSHPKGT